MVCGGLAVFLTARSYRRIIVPNSGGGLWWFAVVCGGLRWFVVVCGGLWWFVVDCGGLSFSHTGLRPLPGRALSLNTRAYIFTSRWVTNYLALWAYQIFLGQSLTA